MLTSFTDVVVQLLEAIISI